ncbi:MAG TPA: prolyl oligopeptidase family serine peptidase [Thermoanaerobaculia bacterium]|nr:prolyl oligopeptidase family serine peptidase [Thermoanaerobaculia bacterium]
MKNVFAVLFLVLPLAPASAAPLHYPESRQVEQTDTFHGVAVADPYRWLETDVRQSAEVRSWVEAENRLSSGYLASIPEHRAIQDRLTQLWTYERRDFPRRLGNAYYFERNDGHQNLPVLYLQRSLLDEPEVLLDPNTWSKDGTVALSATDPSPDGQYLAYGVSVGGSDWRTYHVLDVQSRKVLPDEIQWSKFCCLSWTADNQGFFYTRLPEPAKGTEFQGRAQEEKVYYHRLGTPQSADTLTFEQADHPNWILSANVTEDGRYLYIGLRREGKVFRFLYRDLRDPYAGFSVLVPDFDNQYFIPLGNDGPVFYFRTDYQAPRGRILAIDLRQPGKEHWQEIVPEAKQALRAAALAGNLLIVRYLEDALASLRIFTLGGKHVRDLEAPGVGNLSGVLGRPGDTEAFYAFSSFNQPSSIYRYDLVSGRSTLFSQPKVDFDTAAYDVKRVFYTSKDGTRVPMFLAFRKGLKLDGNNPTLLTAYGGFNIAQAPGFSPAYAAWLEQGGVLALACLRGGGEYGEDWHQGGMLLKKQNVFDDFIAAAEWLIANRYTRPAKLAAWGASNGGLLVGAVLNQRPDLFGAALPAVGVMDMLRYHLFTMGTLWTSEYGTVADAAQFKALYAYSPYHNVKTGTHYPPVLITTGDTDDRVVPGHSFKYAARLQRAQAGDAPVLIRIATLAGHGGADSTTGQIAELADQWAFLVKNLGMAWKGAGGR